MKHIMLILALAFCAFALSSCNSKKTDTTKTEVKVDMNGPEYTSKYICPMYCKGSGSDKMGTCPVCKMDYELNENYKGDADSHEGHDHDSHDGHDHGSHDGHDHGSHDGHNH